MRGVRTGIVGTCLAPLLVVVPAWADASDYYGPAGNQCTITDPRLDEMSGLVVLPTGQLLAVEDSAIEGQPGSTSIVMYRLDAGCALEGGAPAEFAQDPRDIEDLAFLDNTLWFADIGDNGLARQTVALIAIPYDPADPRAEVAAPQVFRFVYPDGPHDAEALLLAPGAIPYIVTKDLLGRSGVYRPGGPLDPAAEVALTRVADLEFAPTGTPGGPVGRAGQVLVTGGAVAADGSHLAVRTYTDAYVWQLSGSDVAGALATEPLAVVALPDAPQGEAISFAADNRSLVVGSEGVDSVLTAIPATPLLLGTEPTTAAPIDDRATEDEADGPSSAPLGSAKTVSAAVIAAALATFLIWLGRRGRRKSGSGRHGHGR